jgi:hypothetical protein
LTVQLNGSPAAFGTRLSADFANTSWKVMPANSGVRTDRTKFCNRSRPGNASGSPTASFEIS